MGRQERRRRLRQKDSNIKWDRILIYVVVAFFATTALFSYLFPQINSRAYASGPRVQRIIINKGVEAVTKKDSLEFMYSYSVASTEDTVQYQVKETGNKVTLTHSEDKEAKEYAIDAIPPEYYTASRALSELKAALRDKSYKIIYPESENAGYYLLRVRKETSENDFEGYDLYFTGEHALDIVHYYKKTGEDKVLQRIYSGLTSGIVEPEKPSQQ